MNKLAFRAKSGTWIYYLTYFTYQEVGQFVKRIDDELHKSKSLNEQIQRSLTDNVEKIEHYIKRQKEHFFNALVLAVYDGDPQWKEIRIEYDSNECYDCGVLMFTGEEKIFPVDGQHRVEGIKLTLQNNPSQFENETIPVILIGHKRTDEGMKRTRRLFSTLNRYAKPVTLNDIIALDEDDIVAIATRYLIENNLLFQEKRLNYHKQKAIPKNDKTAFTNIISLYDCNLILLEYFLRNKQVYIDKKEVKGKSKLNEYRRFRPDEREINEFICFTNDFWKAVASRIDFVKDYLEVGTREDPADRYRNSEGGVLLFRPIGQIPFVCCAVELLKKGMDYEAAMSILNKLNYNMNSRLWSEIVWNSITKKMIMSNRNLIELIMKYLCGISLSEKEMKKMIEEYRGEKNIPSSTDSEIIEYLNQFKVI